MHPLHFAAASPRIVAVLVKRIIPCLDVHHGRVVKGVNFVNLRDAGDPVEAAKAYNLAGADERSSWILPPPTRSVALCSI